MNRFANAGPKPGHDIFGLLHAATNKTQPIDAGGCAPAIHVAVSSDGRTPCDVCDALITTAEAERNYTRWTLHVCDHCANETDGSNA
jgi:hypothetical protein